MGLPRGRIRAAPRQAIVPRAARARCRRARRPRRWPHATPASPCPRSGPRPAGRRKPAPRPPPRPGPWCGSPAAPRDASRARSRGRARHAIPPRRRAPSTRPATTAAAVIRVHAPGPAGREWCSNPRRCGRHARGPRARAARARRARRRPAARSPPPARGRASRGRPCGVGPARDARAVPAPAPACAWSPSPGSARRGPMRGFRAWTRAGRSARRRPPPQTPRTSVPRHGTRAGTPGGAAAAGLP